MSKSSHALCRVVKMKPNESIDYQKLFAEIAVKAQEIEDIGIVASYIPELRNIDPNKFGIHLTVNSGVIMYH